MAPATKKEERVRPSWKMWSLVVGCLAVLTMGCDEEEPAEIAAATSEGDPVAPDEPAGDDEGSGAQAEGDSVEGEASGNVEGEPFVVRGVLAQRIREPKIEVRLFNRPVSCESFDDDYELSEDEKVVVVILEWPKDAGETLALRASNTSDFFQFCHGRESGRASCTPRAPEQGSLTVVAASDEGGELSFDVSSDEGALSGNVAFTLCER